MHTIVKAAFKRHEPDETPELVISNQYGDVLFDDIPDDSMLIAMEGRDDGYFLAEFVGTRYGERIMLRDQAPAQSW